MEAENKTQEGSKMVKRLWGLFCSLLQMVQEMPSEAFQYGCNLTKWKRSDLLLGAEIENWCNNSLNVLMWVFWTATEEVVLPLVATVCCSLSVDLALVLIFSPASSFLSPPPLFLFPLAWTRIGEIHWYGIKKKVLSCSCTLSFPPQHRNEKEHDTEGGSAAKRQRHVMNIPPLHRRRKMGVCVTEWVCNRGPGRVHGPEQNGFKTVLNVRVQLFSLQSWRLGVQAWRRYRCSHLHPSRKVNKCQTFFFPHSKCISVMVSAHDEERCHCSVVASYEATWWRCCMWLVNVFRWDLTDLMIIERISPLCSSVVNNRRPVSLLY